MLICGDCSARNDDGESFCTNCGAYLEWQRPPAGSADKPQAATSGPGLKSPPETAELPQIAVPPGRGPAEPPQGTPGGRRSAAAGNANAGLRGMVRAGNVPDGARQGSGPKSTSDGNAIGDPVTVIDIEPAAVKPGQRIDSAPAAKTSDERNLPAVGEPICAACGTGNQADRSFCRRCAESLTADPVPEAAEAPRLSWWTRLFGPPEGRALPAGTRPRWKSRRFPTKTVALVAALGLLGGAAYGNTDSIGGAPQRVLDEFFDASVPTKMMDSPSIKDRGPEYAADEYSNTSWAAELKGGGAPYLEAKFAKPTRLAYVFITGLSSEPRSQEDQRPAKVLISVRYEGAADGTFQDIFPVVEVAHDTLRHGFYVGADNVRDVRLTIMEPNSRGAKSVSIGGVQFSGR